MLIGKLCRAAFVSALAAGAPLFCSSQADLGTLPKDAPLAEVTQVNPQDLVLHDLVKHVLFSQELQEERKKLIPMKIEHLILLDDDLDDHFWPKGFVINKIGSIEVERELLSKISNEKPYVSIRLDRFQPNDKSPDFFDGNARLTLQLIPAKNNVQNLPQSGLTVLYLMSKEQVPWSFTSLRSETVLYTFEKDAEPKYDSSR